MGREFARFSVKLSETFDLGEGLDTESPGVTSANFYGPGGSHTDVTNSLESLNALASNNTKYTIIDIKDETQEPQVAARVIAQGLASGNTSGNWTLISGIGCTIEGFGQGGFKITPTESMGRSIITFGAGDGVVLSVGKSSESFTVNTRNGNKAVFFVITK
jgi:hypothetical protein